VTGVEYLIEGERVALGPLRRDLGATYARWLNRRDVRVGLAHLGILEDQTEEAWVDETLQATRSTTRGPRRSRSTTAATASRWARAG
jgi:hypothetical protein